MTRKERLKMYLNGAFDLLAESSVEGSVIDQDPVRDDILSLIDRQPAEVDAKDAKAFLHELVETCIDCRGIPSCEHCDSYEICAGGPDRHLETIHRALGFDETGYSSRLREEDE